MTTLRSRGASALIAGALAAAVMGCTNSESDRSADAFCSTMRSEKERILSQFDAASSMDAGDEFLNVLIGLGASFQALGDLQTYFRKLAESAPEEIRVEAELVAETYEEQYDLAADVQTSPLGALAQFVQVMISAMGSSGQVNALDNFAMEHCGEHI